MPKNKPIGRQFIVAVATTTARSLALTVLLTGIIEAQNVDEIDVWIGTSSSQSSQGIYHCMLDTKTGKLTNPSLAAEINGPGFLAMHPNKAFLYAVGSLHEKPVVAAYAIEKGDHGSKLQFSNAVEIGDGGAAHVSIDKTGRSLLTAQYGGGSVAVFSVKPDGSLDKRTQIVEHKGGSRVVAQRQESPHPHWTGYSPDNRFAFVPDLGLDQVVIYKVDAEKSKIEEHGHADLPPGSGPRHLKFHPNGKSIYVVNELELSVTVFDYDTEAGSMKARQTIPAVPKAELAKEKFKSASEIRVHPNGRFVYSANRGHDTISAFRVNDDGTLAVVEIEPVRGATPRNFNLDPSGRWLLAAGQDSHTLAAFEVEPDMGELTYNGSIVFAPSAICVLFQHE